MMRSTALLLFVTGVFCAGWGSVESSSVCHVSERDIICPDSADIADIQAFLADLGSSGDVEYDTFRIYDNPLLQELPEGLLGALRFSQVQVYSCSNLTQVKDFLGASKDTVLNLTMHSNALTEMPQLSAPALQRLEVFQTTQAVALQRSAFQGMPNIQIIRVEWATVSPLAFFDLKNLQELFIYNIKNEVLQAGSFHFNSPALSYVFVAGYVENVEDGTYDGFPNGSRLRLEKSPNFSADLFFNMLKRGAFVESPEPVSCDCHVAWIRLSSFLPQTSIRCHTAMWPIYLHTIDEQNFKDCGTICSP